MHIIFSDIDGTLYPETGVIHPQTIKDIKYAQDNGVEFVICTGNAYLDKMEALAKKLNVRYVINSNGASIFDRKENKWLFTNFIPKDEANEILNIGKDITDTVDWWDEKNVFMHSNNEETKKMLLKILKFCLTDKPIEDKTKVDGDIFKIEFLGKKNAIDKIEEGASKLGKIHIARMKDHHVEITHENSSKGKALLWLTKYLKSDISKVMAIGDSANDHSMLELTDHSYAMDNANKATKNISKRFTSSVEQNGLGEAIIDFMYRQKIDKK